MRNRNTRASIAPVAVLAAFLAFHVEAPVARAQVQEVTPEPRVLSPTLSEPHRPRALPGDEEVPSFPIKVPAPAGAAAAIEQLPAPPSDGGRPLPINLATALRLADARPLVIEAARAAVETEYGLFEQARVLWLPTVNIGADYQRHDGGEADILNGTSIIGPRSQFLAGGGAQAVFALTDAIYAPLAERQLVRARNLQIQTAKNEALLSVALAQVLPQVAEQAVKPATMASSFVQPRQSVSQPGKPSLLRF